MIPKIYAIEMNQVNEYLNWLDSNFLNFESTQNVISHSNKTCSGRRIRSFRFNKYFEEYLIQLQLSLVTFGYLRKLFVSCALKLNYYFILLNTTSI